MITQCPISPHSNFEYRFEASYAGTSFWHAHSATQRADGVFGPLIVRQYIQSFHVDSKYDYDWPEHVITVNDWTHVTTLDKYINHYHNDGDNIPNAILINGKGFLTTNTNNLLPRAIFTVEQDKRYRFRVINAGVLHCPIQMSIEEHNLTIIGTDGKTIKPKVVESFVIFAGEYTC